MLPALVARCLKAKLAGAPMRTITDAEARALKQSIAYRNRKT